MAFLMNSPRPFSTADARERRRRCQRGVWFLLLAIACVYLLFQAWRHDCWTDEGFTMRRIGAAWPQLYSPFSRPVVPGEDPFNSKDVFDYNPPLYFALLRIALGRHPHLFTVRIISILAFLAGLFALRHWARRRLGPGSEWGITLFYLVSPAMLYFGHEGRPYLLALALAMIALTGFWLWADRPRRLLGLGLLLSLAGCLMTFHLAWLVLALSLVLAVQLVLPLGWMGRRSALAGLCGLVGGAVLALAVIMPQWDLLRRAKGSSTDPFNLESIVHCLVLPIAGPFTTTIVSLHPLVLMLWGASFILLLLTLVLAVAWMKSSPRRATGLICLFLWLEPLSLLFLAKGVFHVPLTVRYATIGLPGWFVFIGWFAAEAWGRKTSGRRVALAILAAMLTIGLALDAFMLIRPVRQVWRPAIAELKRVARPGDYYALDPDWLQSAFAVNAHTPPPARFLHLEEGLPSKQGTIWILTDRGPLPSTVALFRQHQWRLTPQLRQGGVSLWKATPPQGQ